MFVEDTEATVGAFIIHFSWQTIPIIINSNSFNIYENG